MQKLAFLAVLAATPAFANQPVTINFAAAISGQPFYCDATYAGLGASGAEIRGTDFRLYVSDVAMIAPTAAMHLSRRIKATGTMRAWRCWILGMAPPPAPTAPCR